MRKIIISVLICLASAFFLAGCGGSGGTPVAFTLTGTVSFGGTDAPVAGATVTVCGASGVTDDLGQYSITGTYTDPWQQITVTGGRAADFSDYVDLSPSATQDLTVRKLYYVDPDTGEGNDANDGSAASPLKTITYALSQPEHKLVQLTAGTYDTESGETFPLNIEDQEEIRGVAGNAAACIIMYTSTDGSGSLMTYAEGPGLNYFKLSYVTLDLQGVTAANQYCLKIAGGHGVEVAHCRFLCNNYIPYGVWIAEGASLVWIDDCTFDKADAGVIAKAGSACENLTATIRGAVMTGCDYGVYGMSAGRIDAVEVLECDISGGVGAGIVFIEEPSDQLAVRNSVISGYGDASHNGVGIEVTGGNILVRGTQIINNTQYGVALYSFESADLGTSTSPGGNTLTGNGLNLMDSMHSGSNSTVYAIGNTWDDPQPAGMVTAGSNGASSDPNYQISFPGNTVVFSN